MKLYNTLTRKVEDVKPLNPPMVTIYTCGPTVYDYPHIGNWFTFIRYDILIRTLKAAGFKPNWVMNITDVGHLTSDADEGEDKLEVGAKREGKTAWDIAQKYSDYFAKGLERLNFIKPDNLAKATDHIPEQIELIKELEKKGYTYKTRDGIYYDTSKFKDYSKLAKLDLEKLRPGARVVVNPEKKNPTDFALWKFSPAHEKRDMEWDSPWGKGFPGWHLECSAIAMKYLGETIDIHAGGIDHIPTHHTNEIAQSEAVTVKPFAKYWLHSNFIHVDGAKMAKSAGNFYTLEDIEEKGFSLEAFRLLVLESNYRTEAHFSWDNLDAAQNRLNNYRAMAALRWQPVKNIADSSTYVLKDIPDDFSKILQNDLDTPGLLRLLSDVANQLEILGVDSNTKNRYNNVKDFTVFLESIDNLLGLDLMRVADISSDQKALIAVREKARKSKKWATADEIRKKLEDQKIGVHDSHHGPIWFKF